MPSLCCLLDIYRLDFHGSNFGLKNCVLNVSLYFAYRRPTVYTTRVHYSNDLELNLAAKPIL